MKVVASYREATRAHFARTRLEAEGIQAFVLDEHSHTYSPFSHYATGGVKVAVAHEDAQRAAAILHPKAATRVRRCPRCDSDDVDGSAGPVFLALIVFAFTLGLLKPKRRCHSCGHAWRE